MDKKTFILIVIFILLLLAIVRMIIVTGCAKNKCFQKCAFSIKQ